MDYCTNALETEQAASVLLNTAIRRPLSAGWMRSCPSETGKQWANCVKCWVSDAFIYEPGITAEGEYGIGINLDDDVMNNLCEAIKNDLSKNADNSDAETNWYFYGDGVTVESIGSNILPVIMVRERDGEFISNFSISDHDFAVHIDAILSFKRDFEKRLREWGVESIKKKRKQEVIATSNDYVRYYVDEKGLFFMTNITDEYFRERHSKLKDYTLVLIKPTSKRNETGADALILEHARKNMALQADGIVSIVCPVFGDFALAGLYIFNVTNDETRKIMDDDPAVKTGIFQYEIYPCKGFPGDTLG